MTNSASLKTFRCNTIVRAFRIARVEQKPSSKSFWNGEWHIVPADDGEPVVVDNQWYLANRPAPGRYYVVREWRNTTVIECIDGKEFEDNYDEVNLGPR